MYNREEAKKIRQDFWDQFKSWSGRKRNRKGKKGRWLMNETGIRQVRLKFHFDEERALAGIEIDTKNLEKRLEIWEKFESLKARLEEGIEGKVIWDLEYPLENGKTVSRIYSELQSVNIYNKEDWEKVRLFLYQHMILYEEFFLEYRDIIKYS